MDEYTLNFLLVVSLVAVVGVALIILTLKEPTPKKT